MSFRLAPQCPAFSLVLAFIYVHLHINVCVQCIVEFKPSTDALVSDMHNALAHLIAVVLGCPPQSSHLWYHMFAAEDLANTYITGFMVSIDAGILGMENESVPLLPEWLCTTAPCIALRSGYIVKCLS